MTDRQIGFLRLVAERLQRQLDDDHDTFEHASDATTTGRRQRLEWLTKRARARLADVEARRHHRPGQVS